MALKYGVEVVLLHISFCSFIRSDLIWWSDVCYSSLVMDELFSFQQRYLDLKNKQIKKPLLLLEWDNIRIDLGGGRTSSDESI